MTEDQQRQLKPASFTVHHSTPPTQGVFQPLGSACCHTASISTFKMRIFQCLT